MTVGGMNDDEGIDGISCFSLLLCWCICCIIFALRLENDRIAEAVAAFIGFRLDDEGCAFVEVHNDAVVVGNDEETVCEPDEAFDFLAASVPSESAVLFLSLAKVAEIVVESADVFCAHVLDNEAEDASALSGLSAHDSCVVFQNVLTK